MINNQIEKPFISIIIATFNAEKSLKRCLNSILSQRFKHIEILIQDGESTDRTKHILKSYLNYIDYFKSCPDKGIYDAWNRALTHARGEWICFLGADDYFTNQNVLENYSKYLEGNGSKKKIIYGINYIVNFKGDMLYSIGKPWQEIRKTFFKTMCLPHPGLMHHRSIFDGFGVFDDTYKIAGDYDLLLRILKHHSPDFWPYPVCTTPLGGISTLPKNNLICLKEIRRAKIINGLKGTGFLWLKQWISALIRLTMWQTLGEKQSCILFDALRKARGLDPFWGRIF